MRSSWKSGSGNEVEFKLQIILSTKYDASITYLNTGGMAKRGTGRVIRLST
jgi:hypothetical protein